jgi:hypothetical protein
MSQVFIEELHTLCKKHNVIPLSGGVADRIFIYEAESQDEIDGLFTDYFVVKVKHDKA